MKYPLSFGIAVCLVCGAFVFAQTSSTVTEQRHEPPASSNATLPNTMGVDLGSLDGAWEGDLTFLQGATLSQKEPATSRYRITIQGSAVHVYMVRAQDVREVKAGLFHIERLMTNAVIYATQSGEDNEGTWVETWVFTVTQENQTTLLTNFARVVNNLDLPLGNDHSKFAKEAAGELKLIPTSSSEQKEEPPASTSNTEEPKRSYTPKVDADYGLGLGRKPTASMGPLEVLSDTMGVDFGPYLQRALHDIRTNWYNVMPESAKAPIMKKGKVTIELAILKDGAVGGMKLVSTSGDVALDHAAWTGITVSKPFSSLPSEFFGKYLALRMTFFYNPDKADLR